MYFSLINYSSLSWIITYIHTVKTCTNFSSSHGTSISALHASCQSSYPGNLDLVAYSTWNTYESEAWLHLMQHSHFGPLLQQTQLTPARVYHMSCCPTIGVGYEYKPLHWIPKGLFGPPGWAAINARHFVGRRCGSASRMNALSRG